MQQSAFWLPTLSTLYYEHNNKNLKIARLFRVHITYIFLKRTQNFNFGPPQNNTEHSTFYIEFIFVRKKRNNSQQDF